MVLNPQAEALFRDPQPDAKKLSVLTDGILAATQNALRDEHTAVLVVAPDVRRTIAGVAIRHVPGLFVMSYREVDPNVSFITTRVIGAESTRT